MKMHIPSDQFQVIIDGTLHKMPTNKAGRVSLVSIDNMPLCAVHHDIKYPHLWAVTPIGYGKRISMLCKTRKEAIESARERTPKFASMHNLQEVLAKSKAEFDALLEAQQVVESNVERAYANHAKVYGGLSA